jgi:hypothetical protein
MTGLIGIAREMTNVTIAPIDIPRFMDIMNESFGGMNQTNQTIPNFTGAIRNTLMVYPDSMGVLAYLIIALIPFSMMWISHGNTKMASVVGLLVIGFIGAFVGGVYMAAGVLFIGISVAATLWGLYKPM